MSKKFRRTTIQDVADRAGVSKSSVSRALNGSVEQNPETTQRILKIIENLDYVPARSAQSLAHGRTLAVALLVPAGMWWEWTLEIMRGIHAE